jgi:hypothetical protein
MRDNPEVKGDPGAARVPLPSWFAEAETLKARVLERLEGMPAEERRLPPRPGAWSAAQVVAHLVLVEERLVEEWRVAAREAPAVRPSRWAGLSVGMANFAMSRAIRLPTIPALDPNEREPGGGGEPGALSERWGAVRGRLPGTFPADDSRPWIIHPIFGPLSCRQFGAFLVAHLRHHLKHWPGDPARARSGAGRSPA